MNRFARTAVVLVTEPPFVPRRLWPSRIANAVAARIPPTLDKVLDQIDITEVIIRHVSVERIVESIDIEAVISKLDVSGIASQVIEDIDLPDLIRDSTGAMASEGVIGVRLQSASADDAIDRVVAYLIPGRRRALREAELASDDSS